MNAKIIAFVFALVACVCLAQANRPFPHAYCVEPVEPGPCRGMIDMYFYNPDTNNCKHFIYGGCHGNHNQFKTLEECARHCVIPNLP